MPRHAGSDVNRQIYREERFALAAATIDHGEVAQPQPALDQSAPSISGSISASVTKDSLRTLGAIAGAAGAGAAGADVASATGWKSASTAATPGGSRP